MTACAVSDCGGAISGDGYCDTCGSKGPSSSSASSNALSTPAASAAAGPPGQEAGIGCTEPGCGGSYASDGYCDTCGSRVRTESPGISEVSAAAASGASAAPSLAIGDSCGRDGCTGAIAGDGYCDTCGLAAEARGAAPSTPSAASGPTGSPVDLDLPSIAAPMPPDTSTRIPGAGTATAQSRRTITSTRTTSARRGIGAGLVVVPETPVGDPATAVMDEAEVSAALGVVPEEERNCSSCGRPVGRGIDGEAGRVQGFCGSCRTQFDFVTNAPSLQVGELVAGQYQILGPLAHGGMGWVYLGRDRAVSDRWVVLKGLLNESDPDAVIAAVAERQFLAQIDHANIVNIYNFVTHRGAGYIVMEMVGGQSLNSKLKKRRRANGGVGDPLPPQEAIAYILGILPAFGYLHESGLVYNDLKPANIMAVGDEVKLIDVGAVMRIDDHQAAIFGTQGFQAPEVAESGPSIASDLYTVGRTLAVMMIRFVFHDGPFLYALPGRDTEPLFARWESLHRFLLRACAFHPDDRFQSAGEMAEQLTGVLREIVAISEGRPRAATSQNFEGDQLSNLLMASAEPYDVSLPDWRVLPSSRVNEEDPAAPFLMSLPEQDSQRSVELLEAAVTGGRVEPTPEVTLHRARELVQIGEDPIRSLTEVQKANPWEWRVQWYRSIRQLQLGQPQDAAEGFSRVWTELPGESAPKLAVALAAELAGEYERAGEVYELVISADPAYVSAAFGLARCQWQTGNSQAVVDAFNRVPPSSAAHYDAQVASARALVRGGPDGKPSVAELQAASTTIERLQLDAAERAELSASVFERALAGVADGTIPAGSSTMLGQDLSERSLRLGLEETYRTQARLAVTEAERFRLIDKANAIRPRSLV